jgi:phosphate/sulfate permease
MGFFEAAFQLPALSLVFFILAMLIAFGFEFVNGFHDTANAVTTVIYTRTMKATPAVIYSGFMNFIGVIAGGTAVAFSIVNLLPVDLLIDNQGGRSLVMVLSLLAGGLVWNLGTWYVGLPVSTSHTLIGSILGVGLVSSLLKGQGVAGVNWAQAMTVMLALIISPLIGFCFSAVGLLAMKFIIRDERLYKEMPKDVAPPFWVRMLLVGTCGGVSFAHGSNDGQKGMGLILLVLIGFLPFHYAMDIFDPEKGAKCTHAIQQIQDTLGDKTKGLPDIQSKLEKVAADVAGKYGLDEIPPLERWGVRKDIYQLVEAFKKTDLLDKDQKAKIAPQIHTLRSAIEFVPLWVIVGVALALGIGTTIGYQRVVITVAEKIGKSHLTFGQGAMAELVAALTILAAVYFKLPVSTTHVLSSGIAGTMAANNSGVQFDTCKRILLAWFLTLPLSILLSGLLFLTSSVFF